MKIPLPVLPKRRVLTVDVTEGGFQAQIDAMAAHGLVRNSAYVCCVNAHMTVEARDPAFAQVVDEADLATPDGMPVLRAMRIFHGVDQERVAGNDIMPALLTKATEKGIGVYLYGSSEQVQRRIRERAGRELPHLRIVGGWSPPYTDLQGMDLHGDAERINASGAGIILVSLGCPKQEKWMASMKGRVNGIMIGVGGAFLLYAGIDKRAPKWMRDLSLEWMYRLWLEPRRLWKRYAVTNSIFLWLLIKEIFRRVRRRR
jgi:N-acetylglucosaminyldiphosphoundecaprenol N-acetyl-beta-D-mannosaminyltransferase